jgi:SWI/SNF-related matrix-associated actin-dependent regulator of chromatin subfamily A3
VPSTQKRLLIGQYLIDHRIVFSFWTKTLDQIGEALEARGISFTRLDGSFNAAARKKVIDDFHNDLTVKTLLMTTGVGAVG